MIFAMFLAGASHSISGAFGYVLGASMSPRSGCSMEQGDKTTKYHFCEINGFFHSIQITEATGIIEFISANRQVLGSTQSEAKSSCDNEMLQLVRQLREKYPSLYSPRITRPQTVEINEELWHGIGVGRGIRVSCRVNEKIAEFSPERSVFLSVMYSLSNEEIGSIVSKENLIDLERKGLNPSDL